MFQPQWLNSDILSQIILLEFDWHDRPRLINTSNLWRSAPVRSLPDHFTALSHVLFPFIIVCSCLRFCLSYTAWRLGVLEFHPLSFLQDSWQHSHTLCRNRHVDTSDLRLLHFLGAHCLLLYASQIDEALYDRFTFTNIFHTLLMYILHCIYTSCLRQVQRLGVLPQLCLSLSLYFLYSVQNTYGIDKNKIWPTQSLLSVMCDKYDLATL